MYTDTDIHIYICTYVHMYGLCAPLDLLGSLQELPGTLQDLLWGAPGAPLGDPGEPVDSPEEPYTYAQVHV